MIQRDQAHQKGAALLVEDMSIDSLRSSCETYDFSTTWAATDNECQYKICPRCRPAYSDRSFLSLNAVARGKTLPTAVAGYGFHYVGGRPIMDANVMRRLGDRHQPVSFLHLIMAESMLMLTQDNPTYNVARDIAGSLNKQLVTDLLAHMSTADPKQDDAQHASQPRLKHSPGYKNLGACVKRTDSLTKSPPPTTIIYQCEPSNDSGNAATSSTKACFFLEESVEAGAPDTISHA